MGHQSLCIILENKVLQKLKFNIDDIKKVNNKKSSPCLIFWTQRDDFWHNKLTLKDILKDMEESRTKKTFF